MIRPAPALTSWLLAALAAGGLGLIGCADQAGEEIEGTPEEVLSPEFPDATQGDTPIESEATVIEGDDEPFVEPPAEPGLEPDPLPVPTTEPGASDAASAGEDSGRAVPEDDELPAVTHDELLARIAENDSKVTLVDCWASWCDPCKENFPHVIDMAGAYADRGLKVIALSFDSGTEVEDIDQAQIAEAKKFLAGLDVSRVENLRHGQLLGESFEAFNITTIPAVFLYDAEGNEVARFTYDDPENQFTYDMVETKVAELLGVEPAGVVEPSE
ncbi:TlpA family protein disulfide reductase [Tautonia plasticadhaerens]|uniref:Thiol-disulfide oxidoreductase ResA n=1 Tax=Tautonia plasticadhaerens TaxID=2527974 RepID=A0A518GXB2_9BACT|nr:TlpA family protein disulfide reductase [Tautonia plasticadhaerens]QDV33225.1 Thiol-disulfide oxidoreductase ResA [Tautonia plasticadhaerens]